MTQQSSPVLNPEKNTVQTPSAPKGAAPDPSPAKPEPSAHRVDVSSLARGDSEFPRGHAVSPPALYMITVATEQSRLAGRSPPGDGQLTPPPTRAAIPRRRFVTQLFLEYGGQLWLGGGRRSGSSRIYSNGSEGCAGWPRRISHPRRRRASRATTCGSRIPGLGTEKSLRARWEITPRMAFGSALGAQRLGDLPSNCLQSGRHPSGHSKGGIPRSNGGPPTPGPGEISTQRGDRFPVGIFGLGLPIGGGPLRPTIRGWAHSSVARDIAHGPTSEI